MASPIPDRTASPSPSSITSPHTPTAGVPTPSATGPAVLTPAPGASTGTDALRDLLEANDTLDVTATSFLSRWRAVAEASGAAPITGAFAPARSEPSMRAFGDLTLVVSGDFPELSVYGYVDAEMYSPAARWRVAALQWRPDALSVDQFRADVWAFAAATDARLSHEEARLVAAALLPLGWAPDLDSVDREVVVTDVAFRLIAAHRFLWVVARRTSPP